MTNFEMVELLRQKANVPYEEAKAALEQANWDLLDAMVLLEKDGKVTENGGSYSTRPEETAAPKEKKHRGDAGARGALRWLWESFVRLVKMGNVNFFVVSRKEKEMFSLPVTMFVLLLIITHWYGLIALAVGLFCGLRYAFNGPNLGKQVINDAMDRAAEAAENMKEGFRDAASGEEKPEAEKKPEADEKQENDGGEEN